jgi:hypothetical protein
MLWDVSGMSQFWVAASPKCDISIADMTGRVFWEPRGKALLLILDRDIDPVKRRLER